MEGYIAAGPVAVPRNGSECVALLPRTETNPFPKIAPGPEHQCEPSSPGPKIITRTVQEDILAVLHGYSLISQHFRATKIILPTSKVSIVPVREGRYGR
jgi:hypothetical protein